jgi:hypothetical protein
VSKQVTDAEGGNFLTEVTTFGWPDDGRRAAHLFTWISRDATSTDQAVSTRAGQQRTQSLRS